MALSVDLGPVRALTEPAVWAVGKTRDPSINFQGESGLQERSSYFRSTYANMSIAVSLDSGVVFVPPLISHTPLDR